MLFENAIPDFIKGLFKEQIIITIIAIFFLSGGLLTKIHRFKILFKIMDKVVFVFYSLLLILAVLVLFKCVAEENFFGGLFFLLGIFIVYNKLKELKSNMSEDYANYFIELRFTHEGYFALYEEDLNSYIAENEDYDEVYNKLKITQTVNTNNNRGYFQLGLPDCKIYWLDGLMTGEKRVMAIMAEVESLEKLKELGGVMKFLYPAINPVFRIGLLDIIPTLINNRITRGQWDSENTDEHIANIAKFIIDKSLEHIQALQAESENANTPTESLIKTEHKEFKIQTNIFFLELTTRYDFSAAKGDTSFSLLIANEETRAKFDITREKILNPRKPSLRQVRQILL